MISSDQIKDPIHSDQTGLHPRLDAVVRRHLETGWQKPIPAHTRAAGDRLLHWLAERQRPLILDSFCGTGMSTAKLAARYPEYAVVGIDKSAARLERHPYEGDYLLLRAECEPLWLVLIEAQVTLAGHFLLYPNPWPKAAHLKRRIHGHPALPYLVRLGGALDLRSNWRIYVEEFAEAMRLAGAGGTLAPFTPSEPLTLFEHKYHARGQQLWRWRRQGALALP